MQIPTLGRILLVVGPSAQANGTDVAPAIITRVWNDGMVNLAVLPDAVPPRIATSVALYATETEARASIAVSNGTAAFWPPRV